MQLNSVAIGGVGNLKRPRERENISRSRLPSDAPAGLAEDLSILSEDTRAVVNENTLDAFRQWGESLSSEFNNAKPFPSITVDNLLNEPILHSCVQEMNSTPLEEWEHRSSVPKTFLKYRLPNARWAKTRECQLIAELQANTYLTEFVKGLSGEPDLVPKPVGVHDDLTGWPLIGIGSGGYLATHSDYNYNPPLKMDRVVTMMLYLNSKEWKDDWGGHLELWTQRDQSEPACQSHSNPEVEFHHKVAPVFNRAFIWKNHPQAYHGHPTPIAAPAGMMRLALQFIWFRKARLEWPKQTAIFCVKCDGNMPQDTCEPNNRSAVPQDASMGSCEPKRRTFSNSCVCAIK